MKTPLSIVWNPGHFVAIAGDPTSWQCVPCTRFMTADVHSICKVNKSKVSRHKGTKKHTQAVVALVQEAQAQENPLGPREQPTEPAAVMSLPQALTAAPEAGKDGPRYDPLEHLFAHGDQILDENGVEIRFSAGSEAVQNDNPSHLRDQLDRLLDNPYSAYDTWGAHVAGIAGISDNLGGSGESGDVDATIADAVMELHLADEYVLLPHAAHATT